MNMKAIFSIILLGIITIGIYSCDKIKNPVIGSGVVAIGTNFDTVTNKSVSGFKKIFLEDYTGHTCLNCPAAARLAETLSDQYKDTLIVIAVHAGFFANTDATFITSYTTTAGNDWDAATGFNVSNQGNPNGMVNRTAYPGFTLVHKDTWATTVSLAKKDTFFVKLNLTSTYDPKAHALNVDSKLTFLKAYSRNVMLSLILIEDSIIGLQKDGSKNPVNVPNYVFNHMLRDAINGSWGELAKAGPSVVNDTAVVKHTNFAVNTAKFNDKNVSLVAFLYDQTSKEILQVEKIKIRK